MITPYEHEEQWPQYDPVADKIHQCRLLGRRSLDLRDEYLAELPSEILELTQLEEINLSDNQFTHVPEDLWKLPKLRRVMIMNNPLKDVPKLPGVMVDARQFLEFRETLECTTYGLQLGDNHEAIDDILADISETKLPGMRHLAIWGQHNIAHLSRPTLKPSYQELLKRLGEFKNLEWLSVWGWNLTLVPEGLRNLQHLRELTLGFLNLTELPKWLGILRLESFGVYGNSLTNLPVSVLGWRELKELYLSYNPISQIPSSIFELPNLEELILRGCQLREIPSRILCLTKLKRLDVEENPITNPPPEVVYRGIEAIRDYWCQREKVGTDYLCEAKLILIGEPGAGKTSLAKKIENADYQLQTNEASTKGIEVIQHRFPMVLRTKEAGKEQTLQREFQMNIWDFGGQEIYKATHQFFLTRRSVYVLVCDERQENTDFSYWLQAVEVLSEGCPLIIVQNEKQDRSRTMDFSKLRARFPNLHQVMAVNLATNRGLPELVKVIEQELGNLPHVGDPLPTTWKKVRTALEEETRETLSLDEYLNLCAQHGFTEHAHKLQLSSYLHDLGICLHFHEDPVLNRTVIIKPTWGTDAVYRVLDDAEVKAKWGRFTHKQLPALWHEPKYRGMEHELVALMMKFQLCYALVPGKEWIAPQLLAPESPAYEWPTSAGLVVRYQYEFLPRGIVTRCIVALHQWIADQLLVWKHGVVLIRDGCRAEIVEEPTQNRIRVRVHGAHPPGLFAIIDAELERLHAGFPKLQYERFLPCNCATCAGSAEPRDFSLKDLLDFARTGDAIQCRGSRKMVNALDLLSEVMPGVLKHEGADDGRMAGMKESPDVSAAREPDVFVSYAWNDASKALVNKIEERLKTEGIALKRDIGEVRYKDSIRDFMKHIGCGKAIVVVLSKKYLESENCMFELVEIAKSKDLRERIFPIVLPDANVYKATGRAGYVKHWDKEIKELDEALKGIVGHDVQNLQADLQMYSEFRRLIDGLTDTLKDMNALTPDIHEASDFEQMIQRIREQVVE